MKSLFVVLVLASAAFAQSAVISGTKCASIAIDQHQEIEIDVSGTWSGSLHPISIDQRGPMHRISLRLASGEAIRRITANGAYFARLDPSMGTLNVCNVEGNGIKGSAQITFIFPNRPGSH